jgi:carboxypeptidase Q
MHIFLMNRFVSAPRLRRLTPVLLLAIVPLATVASAQERIDHDANARIRDEGFHRSRVLETATMLADGFGPRLAGSPGYDRAARWTLERMTEFGIQNARLEPWGRRGAGWEIERFSAEMTAPWYLNLNAIPKAWSTPTQGEVAGTPVLVQIRNDGDMERYRGQLRGRIVMNGSVVPIADRWTVPASRWTDAQLDSLARLTDPGEPASYLADAGGWFEALEQRERIERFFREEGVALTIEGSANPVALRAAGHISYTTEPRDRVPALIVSRSEFNLLARRVQAELPTELRVSIATRFSQTDSVGYNVVGEISGTDRRLRDQVVMVGGHFDTWHVGTGATDNAAGIAVAIEALRILRATGLQPRRTIRAAFWDGEEQEDYLGSTGYVTRNFGDRNTMRLLPAHARLAAYFNTDSGTGRIRGIYTQGNRAVVPIFQAILAPFADLGAATVSIANVGSTDHIPFQAVGLPGFNLIHDRLDYHTRTHHTALDTGDYLIEEDLQQAAVVLASLLLHVANRDELLPRGPLPAAVSSGR